MSDQTRDQIYADVHAGLTWDQRRSDFRVEPGSQWDDDIDGVYRDDDGIFVDANAVNDSFAHNLKEAGL